MNFWKRMSSRKFIIFVVSVTLFCFFPEHFTGDNLVVIMSVFIGGNIFQKMIEKKKK